MSSHLSVSYTSSTGTTVTKALGQATSGTAEDTGAGIGGVFAALLNLAGGNVSGVVAKAFGANAAAEATTDEAGDTTLPAQTSQTTATANLGDLIKLSLDAGSDALSDDDAATADDQSVDPSTIAVPVAATLPIAAQQPLADLVQSLTELSATLTKGDAPTPQLLEKLNKQLDALNAALGVPAATPPSFDDMLKLATANLPADATTDLKLNQKLATLAVDLVTPAAADADATIEGATPLPPLAKDVASKLAALAKTLSGGTIPAETLGKLGLTDTAPAADPSLQKAIATLLNAPVPAAVAAATPVLGAPSLKVTGSALTGKAKTEASLGAKTDASAPLDTKPTDAVAAAKPSIVTAPVDAGTTVDASAAPKDSKDAKPDAPVASASVTAKAEITNDGAAANTAQVATQAATRLEAPAARVAPTVYQTNQQQINIPQIAFEMVRQVQHGSSRFQIRLDPADLGRIDVRLDIDKTGQVNAHMMVEKAETLDLMQRDQRSLQQALQQAGLDGSKTNLEFSLRQNNSGGQNQGSDGGNSRAPAFDDTVAEALPTPTINLYRGNLSASGVNILA